MSRMKAESEQRKMKMLWDEMYPSSIKKEEKLFKDKWHMDELNLYDCENCGYRFKCYTVPKRPIVINNTNIVLKTCHSCIYRKYLIDSGGFTMDFGICNLLGTLFNRNSQACKQFKSRRNSISYDLKENLRGLFDEVLRINRQTKIPKFCVAEECYDELTKMIGENR